MSFVKAIMHFRLNIDREYQGWLLAFTTLTVIWVYCMPCYCAGLKWQCARHYSAKIQMRLPYFLLVATGFNAGVLFLVITWLPDWGYSDYAKCMASGAIFFLKNASKFITSIAFIAIFIFIFAFKDRILKLLGFDYKTVVRFKLRDIFGGSTRAIELVIWKVEDLPAAQVFSPNNVFVEFCLGYNEPMKTRVHNNAGSNCVLKETIQLNFDDNEEDDPLYLFVKNQKIYGAGELARLELKPADLVLVERESLALKFQGDWREDFFVKKQLIPRGQIYFRVTPVVDDEEGYSAMHC